MSSNMEEQQASKMTKVQANYRAAPTDSEESCGDCVYFEPATKSRGYGYCKLVQGRISSEGLCDYWEGDD